MLMVNHLVGFGAGRRKAIATFQQSAVDTTNSTAYTFSSQPVGSGNRKVVVVAAANGSTTRTIASMTVGGQSMTEVVEGVASGNGDLGMWYFDATAALASTADIVVTFGAAVINCGIGIWTVTGAKAGNAFQALADDDQTSPTSVSVSLNVPGNGCVIAGVSTGNSNVTNTFAGVTEDYDEIVESAACTHAGGHQNYAAAQSGLTVSSTLSVANNRAALVAASFGP